MIRSFQCMSVAMLVFLVACSSPESPMPELNAPAWRDGETSVYYVVRNDSTLYRSTVVLRFDEEFGIPTAVVTNTVVPVDAPRYFFDSSQVVFRRDNLTPVRSFRNLETDIAGFDIETRYENGRALIRKQSIDGVEEATLRLKPRSYDNEMVRTLLRTVPLVSGTDFRITAVLPMDLRTVAVDVEILGTKQVAANVGSVTCREIVCTTPTREIRLWYEIAEPRRLIGMRDPQSETEMLLASFTPAGADTLAAGIR